MPTALPLVANPAAATRPVARWGQLLLGLVCMMAISSPQYTWTLFTRPLAAQLHAGVPAVQITFSLLVVVQTFLAPLQGSLVDRFGPRLLIAAGAALTGLSWVLAADAASLAGLYLSYGLLGGLGTGIVYVGVVGQVVAWFPERRGFAAGLVAAGYGMGAIATTIPISASLTSTGYATTLLQFGTIFAVIGVIAAQGFRAAPSAARTAAGGEQGAETGTMLRTPVFWLMFAMMVMMSTSGLMVTSQMAAFASDFGVARVTVWGVAALPLALTMDRLTNGLTRPFFGYVSDRLGRETTMAFAFALEGCAMALWLALRRDPVLFVLLSGLVFFGWGEIFSLFPATLTDTFGTRHATRNYGCLYMAQGIGSVLGGPLASLLHEATGNWHTIFGVAIAADLLTALLACAILRPMRRRYRLAAA